MKDLSIGELKRIALGLLARREHSQQELIQKLAARGFPADMCAEVVSILNHEGLQSDKRFAEAFVHAKIGKGCGPLKITAELHTKGINENVIDQAMGSYKEDWFELALDVYRKKFGEDVFTGEYKEQAKRMRFLQSRGFTTEQIQSVVKLNNE